MSLKSKAASVGIAAAILAGTIVPTMAAEAVAATTLNVRACASTSCRVVDVLRRGERVEVEYCRRDNWCFITRRGPDGFVNARYLTRGHDRFYDDDFYDDDFYITPRRRIIRPYNPGVSVCFGSPNARFCVYD
jgi:uncharacterized protein YraI